MVKLGEFGREWRWEVYATLSTFHHAKPSYFRLVPLTPRPPTSLNNEHLTCRDIFVPSRDYAFTVSRTEWRRILLSASRFSLWKTTPKLQEDDSDSNNDDCWWGDRSNDRNRRNTSIRQQRWNRRLIREQIRVWIWCELRYWRQLVLLQCVQWDFCHPAVHREV